MEDVVTPIRFCGDFCTHPLEQILPQLALPPRPFVALPSDDPDRGTVHGCNALFLHHSFRMGQLSGTLCDTDVSGSLELLDVAQYLLIQDIL